MCVILFRMIIINSYGLKNNKIAIWRKKIVSIYINSDDNINKKNIFILAGFFFFFSLKRHRFCCFGNTTVFHFSLLCRRTHTHTRSMLTRFSSFFLYYFCQCYYLLLPFSLSLILLCIFFVSCLMSTLLNERHTQVTSCLLI